MISKKCLLVKMDSGKPVKFEAGEQTDLIIWLLQNNLTTEAKVLAKEQEFDKPKDFIFLVEGDRALEHKDCNCPDIENGWYACWVNGVTVGTDASAV